MISVILHGSNGRMGQVVSDIIEADPDVEITAGIDVTGEKKRDYPVYSSLTDCTEEADAIIDFSTAAAVDPLIAYGTERNIPMVICTTGLSETQIGSIREAGEKVAVFRSANMSLGINLLLKILKENSKVLCDAGFDPEIIEMHHSRKLDAPSGTALMLADAVNSTENDSYTYTFDRSQRREKRDPKEIGISSVRGGTIVGEHDVIFAGQDEVVEFRHTAYSRAIFAKGAVAAAKFLSGKGPGLYDMSDVIG